MLRSNVHESFVWHDMYTICVNVKLEDMLMGWYKLLLIIFHARYALQSTLTTEV